MKTFFTRRSHWLLVVGIILSFVAFSVGSATRESLTYDEIVHSQEGLNHIQKHTFAIDTYNPPLIRELQMVAYVIPGFARYPTGFRLGGRNDTGTVSLFPARLVTILLGMLLLISVYLVGRKYFGKNIGLVALLLLAFEPNMLAHSHYVTLDTGTALFFFWAYMTFLQQTALFGVALGLALASRVMVIPYIAASGLLAGLVQRHLLAQWRYLILALLISATVVWGAYFFRMDVIIAQREDADRVSAKLKNSEVVQRYPVLQYGLYILENTPLPLGNYLATVKNSMLRGMQSTQRPVWYEMIVNVFLKTPIPLLLLLAFALWTVGTKTLVFFIPVVSILGVATLTGMEPRVRYVLAMYPFLAIVAAKGVGEIGERWGIRGKIISAVLLLWYVTGTLLGYPHFISYANELLPRNSRYLYFTDSNIDWGQSLPDLASYVNTQKPNHVSFSYFGRDNGNDYGLISNRAWGSYQFEEVCAFHEISLPFNGEPLIAISVSNWHGCGYSKQKKFEPEHISEIVGDSILIFR